MTRSFKVACSLLACALLSQGALAESAPAPKPQSPAAGSTPAPPVAASAGFESVFSRYRSYRAIQVTSWRDINFRVAEIGGWKAYARQASAADEPQSASPPGNPVSDGAPPSRADEHAGHEGSSK